MESSFRDALKYQIIIHHSIAYLDTNLFLFFSTEWLPFLCACGSVAGLRSRAVNRDRIVDTNSQGPASLCRDVWVITQLRKKKKKIFKRENSAYRSHVCAIKKCQSGPCMMWMLQLIINNENVCQRYTRRCKLPSNSINSGRLGFSWDTEQVLSLINIIRAESVQL